MKSWLIFVAVIIIGCGITVANDKSDNIKPRWLNSLPVRSNNTFSYKIESGVGNSLNEARTDCFNSLIQDAGFEKGVSVKTDYKTEEEEHSSVINGKSNDIATSHFSIQSTIKGKDAEVQGVKIDEYWELSNDGKYHLWTLYARSEMDQTPYFDNVEKTTHYGMTGLWRSAIVPGWGQLYKGSTLKGSLILSGTAVLIGATVYMDCMRADYANKILKTHLAENKRAYATRRNNFATGRNICIGAIGALYVYNLVDAIVSPGARRILVHKLDDSKKYSVLPTLSPEGSPAMALTLEF